MLRDPEQGKGRCTTAKSAGDWSCKRRRPTRTRWTCSGRSGRQTKTQMASPSGRPRARRSLSGRPRCFFIWRFGPSGTRLQSACGALEFWMQTPTSAGLLRPTSALRKKVLNEFHDLVVRPQSNSKSRRCAHYRPGGLTSRVRRSILVPYLYPTPEGQARAEWPGSQWEVIANIDLDAKLAEVLAVRLDSDRIDEERFPLDQPGGEIKLGRFVTEHLQVA